MVIGRYFFIWSGFKELNFLYYFFLYILIAKPYLESGQYNTSAIYETILRAFPIIMLPYLQDYQWRYVIYINEYVALPTTG